MGTKERNKSEEERITLTNEYIRKNTWRRFLKYKIYELGIIPSFLLALWKLPLWVGWGIIRLFNINPITNPWFCTGNTQVCNGITYSIFSIWLFGFFVLFVLSIFIGLNYYFAKSKSEEEAKKKKFKITSNKGFHVTFENGWTISVQFGWGNYSDDHNAPIKEAIEIGKFSYASDTAEIWSWNGDEHYPESPLGYQTPEQVLKFINKVSRKKGHEVQ
jgi:hypothetical protein